MATLVFQAYINAGPTWTTLQSSGQLIGFYGNAYPDKVATSYFQTSTHISGASGDVCVSGGNHCPNVTYISPTEFNNGSGTQTLNDANLSSTECTLKVFLSGGSTMSTQNGRFYCYNGTAVVGPAQDIQVYAYEQGISSSSGWVYINNGSDDGGDNAGKRLPLEAHPTPATTHEWFVAVSCSPMSVGAKTAFAFGSTVEYY